MATSPFPGMDPYLESSDIWSDVHSTLIPLLRDQLVPQVAPTYMAELDTQIVIERMEDDQPKVKGAIPDVAVTHPAGSTHGAATEAVAAGGVATMDIAAPTPLRFRIPLAYEVRIISLYIRRQEDKKLVTAVELLSPVNKRTGPQRRKYLNKRAAYFDEGIHLIEIDLLRSYPRMPLEGELPPCDYVIMVSDAKERPDCSVWPISVRQPLPIVPVPLLQPDEPVALDIGMALRTAYERARYDLRVDYTCPEKFRTTSPRPAMGHNFSGELYTVAPEPPLSDADAEWIATRNSVRVNGKHG